MVINCDQTDPLNVIFLPNFDTFLVDTFVSRNKCLILEIHKATFSVKNEGHCNCIQIVFDQSELCVGDK